MLWHARANCISLDVERCMDPESRTLAPNVSTWYRRFRDHGKLAEPRPRRPRMLPLVDLCMLFLTENIDEVSSAALDSLLSKYLYSLYKELARRGLSLHSWKLFSHALPRRTCKIPLGAYCYYRDIEPPFAEDLSVYTGPLTSPTVEFISNLYIEDASCFTVSDLLTLADMRNLGVLALHAYSHIRKDEVHASPVSDRLVRGWSEKERPFPLLRVLDLITSPVLTFHVLRYASRFPSLTYCHLATTGLDLDRFEWKSASSVADWGWKLHHSRPPCGGCRELGVPAIVSLSPCKGEDHTELSINSEHRATTHELQPRLSDYIAMSRLFCWSRYLAQGEAIGDADLVHQGVDVSYQASITDMENDNTSGTPFLLPPKPSAYLRLSRDSGQHKVHPKRCEAWYTRDFTPTMSRVATNTTTEDKPDKRMAKPLKQTARKRQCLGDLLKY